MFHDRIYHKTSGWDGILFHALFLLDSFVDRTKGLAFPILDDFGTWGVKNILGFGTEFETSFSEGYCYFENIISLVIEGVKSNEYG